MKITPNKRLIEIQGSYVKVESIDLVGKPEPIDPHGVGNKWGFDVIVNGSIYQLRFELADISNPHEISKENKKRVKEMAHKKYQELVEYLIENL